MLCHTDQRLWVQSPTANSNSMILKGSFALPGPHIAHQRTERTGLHNNYDPFYLCHSGSALSCPASHTHILALPPKSFLKSHLPSGPWLQTWLEPHYFLLDLYHGPSTRPAVIFSSHSFSRAVVLKSVVPGQQYQHHLGAC